MSAQGLFVTGTDTEVGKTWVSRALLLGLKQQGYTVLGMKPVAAGCVAMAEGLRNDDAECLRQVASHLVDYDTVNPYAFEPPMAPHVAAERAGVAIELPRIRLAYQALCRQSDWVVVEGVGGWAVPLSQQKTVADLVPLLNVPVVLVVGLRLGCLNHALLTAEAIERSGSQLVGWVGSEICPDYLEKKEVIDCLGSRLGAPCLGILPYAEQGWTDALAECLDLTLLLDLHQEVG